MEDAKLICPRCRAVMDKQQHLRAIIDHCRKCDGNFFDEGEMLRTLGRSGDPDMWGKAAMDAGKEPEITCPRCTQMMSLHRIVDRNLNVEIDRCGACQGLWLDGGEAEALMRVGARQLAAEVGQQANPAQDSTSARARQAAAALASFLEQSRQARDG